ncbi:MAG: response regulator [Desulfovibrionaceae bacterium]|nr:response regulator [Desulfovibrionaceae bacterium]
MNAQITTQTEFSQNFLIRNLRALRESALLLRQNNDGSTDVLFVSEKFAALLEGSLDEVQNLLDKNGFAGISHQEDRIFFRRMLRRRINEEGGSNLVARIKTLKGNILWCDIHFSFLTDFDAPLVYCTFFNITTLKEYEQRLKSAYTNLGNNFYRADDATLGLFRINLTKDAIEDMQGRDLYGSDSLITPYSVFLKKRSDTLVSPEDRAAFVERFDPDELLVDYLKGTTRVKMTVYSRRPDLQCRFVTYSSNTIRHPLTGDIIAFLAERDANHRKVVDTLINRTLSQQFDMVAWLSDGTFGVVIGNPSRIKKGSIFPLAMQGNYQAYLTSQVAPVLQGTKEERTEMLNALSEKTVFRELEQDDPYIVNIPVFVDGAVWYKRFDFYTVDNSDKFCIILKSDTTDIQRRQIEINSQLQMALKEAQQASVAKTSFLSRMSHEIRTPMNAIIGLGTLALREKDLSAHNRDYITKIGSSARYLLSLINDILDMSRIESGRMVLKNEQFSFRKFLELVNTVLDGQCREKGLKYTCHIKEPIGQYYIGDDTKLRQVLINILGNSVKFTNEGGSISLMVEQISSYEGRAIVRFIIADTGIGMDESYLPKIFEPFTQEDASNTTKYGGSGLGLAITKNIVTLLGGDISVASEKGKGTQFTVNVSLREVADADAQKARSFNLTELKILVVGDDPVSDEHDKSVFEELGLACEFSRTGSEALQSMRMHEARRDPFTVILLDMSMPEKDGIEVAKEIHAVSDEVCILLTAYSTEEIEDAAREAGVNGIVQKPLIASRLLDALKTCHSQHDGDQEEIASADIAGRRILLAEDVAINAEIICELLDSMEISVDHVENGALAVEAFAGHPPYTYDAILMDVRMPVMDGLTAAKNIRELDTQDAKIVPIIAMTANAFDEDVQLSLRAGMNAHLTKPVDPARLQETLSQLIGKYDKEKSK